jgi:hypothetical protein
MLNKGLVKYNNFTFVGFLTVTDWLFVDFMLVQSF